MSIVFYVGNYQFEDYLPTLAVNRGSTYIYFIFNILKILVTLFTVAFYTRGNLSSELNTICAAKHIYSSTIV